MSFSMSRNKMELIFLKFCIKIFEKKFELKIDMCLMLSEQYHYELKHIGQSSHEDGPVEFSFVFNNDMINHEEALERYRRAAINENEKIPSESTPHEQQRQQQAALQQPSSQSQLQQQQSQTVVNASNTPINVSYLTDYTTESSIATPSSSLTTVSTGEKEIVMTSAVPMSNQETSTSIYFRKNSSTKESVRFLILI